MMITHADFIKKLHRNVLLSDSGGNLGITFFTARLP